MRGEVKMNRYCDLHTHSTFSDGTFTPSQIIDEAVDLYNNLKDKSNHPEGNKRAYYRNLTKEMFEKIDELCEKLSSVVSKQA